MVILDLFSGAGGLSEGFFRIDATFVGHIEMDRHACETLRTRTAYWNLKKKNQLNIYHDYLLQKITRDNLWEKSGVATSDEIINAAIGDGTYETIVETVKHNLAAKKKKSVDLIIGGPPCQAYSLIGRSRMGEKVHSDHRNYLYEYYVKFLHEFKPKLFIFENVPGLKNAGGGKYYKSLMRALRKEYYVPEPQIQNAKDFGVLQNRRRYIIVGARKDLANIIDINNLVNEAKDKKKPDAIVADLFDDLPPLEPGQSIGGKNKYIRASSEYLKYSKIRSENFNILTQHIARPHNDRDRNIYKEAIRVWNREGKKMKYTDLPPEWMTHKNTSSFLDRFNVVKKEEAVTQTMVAHIAKDGHYFIHPDIKQRRSISVREAARIQSFPDDFFFEGPRTAIFTQIGNAVPPLMAEKIAEKISAILSNDKLPKG